MNNANPTAVSLTITAIFDYIVEVSGNYAFHQYQFLGSKDDPKLKMMVISATTNKAYCLVNGTFKSFFVGAKVVPIEVNQAIYTSKEHFGKIIDVQGNIVFPTPASEEQMRPKTALKAQGQPFNVVNPLLDYDFVNEQLETGYIAIDLLIPIGKGQRELIIGDRKTGKTFLAVNTIINQKNKQMACIYVGIGQTHLQIANVYQMLKENNALDYTIMVNAPADNPYEQYLAPYVGMAHAENLATYTDVLIIFDDLSTHANILREIALLTNKPVGKEAFPGDTFFAHSSLLERSGKFKSKKSITALPIVQTIDNDITSLIASNLISITDGQIVTNSELFAANKIPAINIDLSVSRIGSNVQKPHIAAIAKEIGKIYYAYRRQIKLAALKYDLNEATNTLIANGLLIEKMFTQKGVSVYSSQLIFLTSKLIYWNILKDVSNIPLALDFLTYLIGNNETAKNAFVSLFATKPSDEKLVKNYFAYCLDQFSHHNDLAWKISYEQEFIALNDQELADISKKFIQKYYPNQPVASAS